MNIALIIAGGIGQRTHQDIPKQFINVHDKPIIIYTLEAFQKHPNIDAIEIVCLNGWQDILRAYTQQFGITKLENIVVGGKTGQDSIRNGLFDIAERYHDDNDIVLIHDAIRPMVSADIISDNIRVCREYGNAITVIPCTSVMLQTEDSIVSDTQIPRDKLKITQTPQSFFINELGILGWWITPQQKQAVFVTLAYFSATLDKNLNIIDSPLLYIFKKHTGICFFKLFKLKHHHILHNHIYFLLIYMPISLLLMFV